MSFLKEISIGKLKLSGNLFLSPMAGITNYAFRKVCLESGSSLVFTEMVSAQSLARGNLKTLRIARLKDDRPVCEQIFGSDEEIMRQAALKAEELGPDMLEINASCPMKKIIKTGAGAGLMRTPALLYRITETVARSVKLPLSVKIRTGFEQKDETAIEIAKTLQNCGISCLQIHLRPVSQIHSGPVNYDIGRRLKEILKVPLIVNGAVTSPDTARIMFEKTGADAVSIGRGAVTNPLIFTEITESFSNKEYKKAGEKERADLFLRFLKLNCQEAGEKKGVITARKLIGLWLKNFRNASHLRSEFMKITTLQEAENLLSSAIRYR